MRDVDRCEELPLGQSWVLLAESLLAQRAAPPWRLPACARRSTNAHRRPGDQPRAIARFPAQSALHDRRHGGSCLVSFQTIAASHSDAAAPVNPLLEATTAAAAEVGANWLFAGPALGAACARLRLVGRLLWTAPTRRRRSRNPRAGLGANQHVHAASHGRGRVFRVSLRFVEESLPAGDGEAGLREAYARATVAMIDIERAMPLFHRDLSELRPARRRRSIGPAGTRPHRARTAGECAQPTRSSRIR